MQQINARTQNKQEYTNTNFIVQLPKELPKILYEKHF